MAQPFTSQDARDLIQLHRDCAGCLDTLCALPEYYKREAAQTAGELARRGWFNTLERQELLSGSEAPVSMEEEHLLRPLSAYRNCGPLVQTAGELRSRYGGQVEADIRTLTPAVSGLRWMLSFGRQKQQIIDAYNRLAALMSGGYAQQVRQLMNQAEALKQRSRTALVSEFEADREGFRQALAQAAPQVFRSGSGAPEAERLGEEYDALEKGLRQGMQREDYWQNNVRTAVNEMTEQAVVDLMKNIPLEEVNRGSNAFRLKPLREAGYENMADIYCATPWQLSQVRGISSETALAVKQMAEDYARQMREGVKLRLSTDRRTRASGGLVRALGGYQQYQRDVQEAQRLKKSRGTGLNTARKQLKQTPGGADWFFSSPEEKRQQAASYRTLREACDGEYGTQARRLTQRLSGNGFRQEEDAWNDFGENSISYFNTLEQVAPSVLGNDDSMYGLPEDLAKAIDGQEILTDGLNCSLRRYQEWGVKYILHQQRALLGDEMGLGKTVQAIAAMVSLRNSGADHFVVVCPASVLPNWCKEITQKSDLSVIKVHGADRKSALEHWKAHGGVAVTTFETTLHFRLEEDFRFSFLVVDEAHYIKNPEARRTVNVISLASHAERILFMTGTALENNVDEMLNLLSVLQPEISSAARSMAFMSSAPQFREKIAPVYYRRKREDVLTELPELIESKEWCTLSADEEEIYEQTLMSGNYAAIRRVSWNAPDPKKSAKAQRMLELVEEAAGDGRKVIVFSFFLETIKTVQKLLGDRCTQAINGSVSVQRRQEIVDEFNAAPAGTVLAAQIQSGGTGLNIQGASVVILCEPQFKPSIENQAISRAYRMGQSRNVLVYRLLCEDTVDEKITALLEQKQAVFDAFADTSAVGEESLALDEKTFGTIVQEEIERIQAKKNEALPAPETILLDAPEAIEAEEQAQLPAPEEREQLDAPEQHLMLDAPEETES